MNMIAAHPLPIPHPFLLIPNRGETAASNGTPGRLPFTDPKAFSFADPDAARKAYHAKRTEWAKLALNPATRLRQEFADEAFMRDHIKIAGLRAPDSSEPTTVTRLRTQLTRAGVRAPEIQASIGTSLAGFLILNPRLPLWAALALVLESTGRFTQMADARVGAP